MWPRSGWAGAADSGELPSVRTSEDGTYRIPLRQLGPGRYDLVLAHGGDIDHRAAKARARVRVR